MSEQYRKAKVVDGYMALKAAQRAAKPGEQLPDAETPVTGDPSADASPPRIGAHIARTVMPTRLDLTCYECGFEFLLSGRSKSTYCPRCRGMLNLQDILVEGESRETVCTGGTLTLAATAVLKAGELRGGEVVLLGRIDGGRVRADRCLEIGPEAQFQPGAIETRDLRVRREAQVKFQDAVHFRNVNLQGELHARELALSGCMRVASTGCFQGSVEAPGLEIEEGGGLLGRVKILPDPESA